MKNTSQENLKSLENPTENHARFLYNNQSICIEAINECLKAIGAQIIKTFEYDSGSHVAGREPGIYGQIRLETSSGLISNTLFYLERSTHSFDDFLNEMNTDIAFAQMVKEHIRFFSRLKGNPQNTKPHSISFSDDEFYGYLGTLHKFWNLQKLEFDFNKLQKFINQHPEMSRENHVRRSIGTNPTTIETPSNPIFQPAFANYIFSLRENLTKSTTATPSRPS